ncbi:hypothetical protein FisN_18Lh276 [Fistulifera solaris]|uniref:Uncharacterized protein n=1 Tax=Fistulifera solaris TaxID=1519565 RepID=A0A1Z5JUC6_FISSO|nr:hypothetical protein FisN_18Lh276 [Fistulifera solaris]|eukprot:GAX17620.1 hypothetical protein FisN_18Lh276 [Fistulifera solaris]
MLNPGSSSRASAMRLQHPLQKVSQTSRESWQLTRACWKSSPSSSLSALSSDRFKAILLEQAQLNNRVAARILLLEKEWSLLKYHGASKYLQQKWSSRRALPSANHSNQQPNAEQRSNKNKEVLTETAQIAFMITSRMKQQLREELGYNETLLKDMTPLQASLVLQNQIIADNYNDELPQLEEDYHKQQELKRKEEGDLRVRIEQREAEGNQVEPVNESPRSTYTDSSHSKQVPPQTPFLQHSSVSSVNQSTGGNKVIWYEVIQTQPDGEEQKMGLYKCTEEAQEGIDALQYIAERRKEKKDVKFSIRPSLR